MKTLTLRIDLYEEAATVHVVHPSGDRWSAITPNTLWRLLQDLRPGSNAHMALEETPNRMARADEFRAITAFMANKEPDPLQSITDAIKALKGLSPKQRAEVLSSMGA